MGLAILGRTLREKRNHSEIEKERLCEVKRGVWVKRSALRLPSKGSPVVGNPTPTIQIDCEPKQRLSPTAIFWVRTKPNWRLSPATILWVRITIDAYRCSPLFTYQVALTPFNLTYYFVTKQLRFLKDYLELRNILFFFKFLFFYNLIVTTI